MRLDHLLLGRKGKDRNVDISCPFLSRSEIRSFLSYSFLIKLLLLVKGGHLFCEGAQENGGIAQLVERLPCKQEVIGSNPITSTIDGLIAQLVRAHA